MRCSQKNHLEQVRKLCTVPSQSTLVRGKRFEDAMAATSAGYDLLVMGSPTERGLSAMFGTPKVPDRNGWMLCAAPVDAS